jgi:hypothetical protein
VYPSPTFVAVSIWAERVELGSSVVDGVVGIIEEG